MYDEKLAIPTESYRGLPYKIIRGDRVYDAGNREDMKALEADTVRRWTEQRAMPRRPWQVRSR